MIFPFAFWKAKILDGLISFYAFENNGNDSKGLYNLTNIGTPAYGSGKIGNSLTGSSSATADYLRINSSPLLSLTRPKSIAFWFKVDTGAPNIHATLFTKTDTVSTVEYDIWFSEGLGSNTLNVYTEGTSHTTSFFMVATGVDLNVWNFVTILYDTNLKIARILLNGNQTDFYDWNGLGEDLAVDNYPLVVGTWAEFVPSAPQYHLDSLGFWDRLLSQEEILYLYNNGNGRALF